MRTLRTFESLYFFFVSILRVGNVYKLQFIGYKNRTCVEMTVTSLLFLYFRCDTENIYELSETLDNPLREWMSSMLNGLVALLCRRSKYDTVTLFGTRMLFGRVPKCYPYIYAQT